MSAFSLDARTGRPLSYCRPCNQVRMTRYRMRKGVDDAWWRQEMARNAANHRRYAGRRRRARRTERGEMARVLLADVWAHGLSRREVERVAGIAEKTQRRIAEGSEMWHEHVLDRLLTLQQACRDVPAWPYKQGQRHPHLAEIERRYQAVRAATA